jgi:hypothetical protein
MHGRVLFLLGDLLGEHICVSLACRIKCRMPQLSVPSPTATNARPGPDFNPLIQ